MALNHRCYILAHLVSLVKCFFQNFSVPQINFIEAQFVASKKFKRASQPSFCLFKRTSCPLLVLRVSSRCLIYKVHALPQWQELIQYIIPFCCCQVLFSNFFRSFSAPKVQIQDSHPAAHRSRSELLYDTTSCFACQALFHFVVSRQARPKRCALLLGYSLART